MKAKYGVPDGVCSFSMGERFESWNKKLAVATTAKDQKARLAAVEGLLKDLKTYEAALKSAKPAKFKGKTPSEQAKSLKDTENAVHTETTTYQNLRSGIEALANPLGTLKTNLGAAKNKLNSIQKTDLQGLKDFYSDEYRNIVGKYVKMALAQKPAGKLKTALDAYVTAGEMIDHLVDNTANTDLPGIAKIYAACKMGIEGLSIEMG